MDDIKKLLESMDRILESEVDYNIGDPVIITGNVQFHGKTGDVVGFSQDKKFVVVDLYNYGHHSFHSSDVSYNDNADDRDDKDDLYDSLKKEFETFLAEAPDPLQSRLGLNANNKHPRIGQTNLRDIPTDNYPGAGRKFSDRDREQHPTRVKSAIKGALGTHTKPNLPEATRSTKLQRLIDRETEIFDLINQIYAVGGQVLRNDPLMLELDKIKRAKAQLKKQPVKEYGPQGTAGSTGITTTSTPVNTSTNKNTPEQDKAEQEALAKIKKNPGNPLNRELQALLQKAKNLPQ